MLDQIWKLYSLNCSSLVFKTMDNLITPLTLIVCAPYGRLIYKLFQGEVNNALASESKPKSRFSG